VLFQWLTGPSFCVWWVVLSVCRADKEAVGQLFDTISDEIEVGRACQQLATNLADTLAVARQGEPCRIDVLDVLPLQVLLTRHVSALEEIFEAFNAL
jgi:hypothetical protein